MLTEDSHSLLPTVQTTFYLLYIKLILLYGQIFLNSTITLPDVQEQQLYRSSNSTLKTGAAIAQEQQHRSKLQEQQQHFENMSSNSTGATVQEQQLYRSSNSTLRTGAAIEQEQLYRSSNCTGAATVL